MIKIHPRRQSIVKTVDSTILRIYCYFVLLYLFCIIRSGTIYGFNHETACLILWFNNHNKKEIDVFYIKSWNICTYSVYFKSKKELNYNRFVDPNILGASRLVHSDLRIYRISFFLLDGVFIMVGCVLSQVKPSELYIPPALSYT